MYCVIKELNILDLEFTICTLKTDLTVAKGAVNRFF